MEEKLQELKTRLGEITDLTMAGYVLGWDQETYMPPGGAPARARQLALLGRLTHERAVDPALGRLLDDLRPYEENLAYDSDDASLIRVARRDFERNSRVPAPFMAALEEHVAHTVQAWIEARPADDFSGVRPYLEKTLDLSRQYAGFFPGYEHVADPLIDRRDRGLTVSILRPLFDRLRAQLAPLIRAIAAQPVADDACLRRHFPAQDQWDLSLEILERLGYDLQRGRQDSAPHPFTVPFSIGDVRVTVRTEEDFLGELLFAAMHEGGHALYAQGGRPELEGTPLAGGVLSGVHESQSRLWENLVGRSRAFWTFFYPRLRTRFPLQLGAVSLDTFYRAINKVEPSLIRTAADEVTYDLHIMVRFDLEVQLLEGTLAVRDLPDAWRERYRADLGLVPPDDRDGVLQDVQWYSGMIGGRFQGYTLGNIMAAQFYAAALQAHPEIPAEMARGAFGTLHRWLRDHIYQHGRKYTAAELLERVTGGPLRIEPYVDYLRDKYGALYALPAPDTGGG
jgi:carboxypeptidase Taq